MPRKPAAGPISIPRAVVEYVLLGPLDDRRQLQDSPIQGDVWTAFANEPDKLQDLLITPFGSQPAGHVARVISARMPTLGRSRSDADTYANIAYLQGLVAARMYFEDLLRVILPLTRWWQDKMADSTFVRVFDEGQLKNMIGRTLRNEPSSHPPPLSLEPIDRYVTLTGLLLWARNAVAPKVKSASPAEWLKQVKQDDVARQIFELFQAIVEHQPGSVSPDPLVWQVSLNRRTAPALDKSVAAIKADAAKTLFSVACDEISWAVLDSGIDGSHPAFADDNGKPRIKQAFDFRNIRQIVSLDNVDAQTRKARVEQLISGGDMNVDQALKDLQTLAEDAEQARPIHWELVRRFVEISPTTRPYSAHGTHVSGILGGRSVDKNPRGVCPDIRLYDFRVLSKTAEDTEFAVISALQYIRHLNSRSSFVAIHGVNLSLSIRHDVRNFACGRTPVCNECEKLIDNGLVVVAAAGNHGYQRFETSDGGYDGYAAFSITDPGNADGVITVGSTHRYWPHTYGVSFFSSRGPTGDGRPKPDLVAPGERIRAPLPGASWGELDGTSMAAPHVSGAAAMLMARYPELIGQPRRIKRILCDSATDLGRERSFQGHGMLDILRAFQSI